MALKKLRHRLGLTQQHLAKQMKTTQQTIARWESGKTPIPSAYLKDLASLLGVGVEALLGAKPDREQMQKEGFASVDHDRPFGTLRATFTFGVRDYPIDEQQKGWVMEKLDREEHKRPTFWSLDNRLVAINKRFLRSVELITDDVEGMPFFASAQAYKNLTDQAAPEQIGPHIRKEMDAIIRALSNQATATKKVEEIVATAMNETRVVWADGTTKEWPLITDFEATFLEAIVEVQRDGFQIIQSDGEGMLGFVNLAEAAAIEAPLQRYLDILDSIPL